MNFKGIIMLHYVDAISKKFFLFFLDSKSNFQIAFLHIYACKFLLLLSHVLNGILQSLLLQLHIYRFLYISCLIYCTFYNYEFIIFHKLLRYFSHFSADIAFFTFPLVPHPEDLLELCYMFLLSFSCF